MLISVINFSFLKLLISVHNLKLNLPFKTFNFCNPSMYCLTNFCICQLNFELLSIFLIMMSNLLTLVTVPFWTLQFCVHSFLFMILIVFLKSWIWIKGSWINVFIPVFLFRVDRLCLLTVGLRGFFITLWCPCCLKTFLSNSTLPQAQNF